MADALARHRQVFGGRGDVNAVFVQFENIGRLQPVEHDFFIRVVRDQVNRASDVPRLLPQGVGQPFERFPGIHHPRRVVGRIDDHRFCFRCHRIAKRFQIDREIVPRVHNHGLTPVVVGIKQILHEIRRKDDDLVTGIEQGFESDIQSPRRTADHNDVVGGQGNLTFFGERFRHRPAGGLVSGVGHVAVVAGSFIPGGGDQGIDHLLRGLCDRVPKGQIEHVVGAEFLLQPDPLFKHLADPRGPFHEIVNFF